MVGECVFCEIARGKIEAKIVYRSDRVVAFEDLNAQAPTHLLIIPIEHFESLLDFDRAHGAIMVEIFEAAKKIAIERKLDRKGFRLVNNSGADGGQTVGHIHFHLLGGRRMGWPPG